MTIHPQTVIGHVHLKVSDLERSVDFYRKVLGFELTTRYGDEAAFLSAGGYHHHIALNTWESRGGPQPAPGTTGLYHFAIRVPNRRELARMFVHLREQGVHFDGLSDHGVSEALYFRDPDGNGIEVYADRDREEWPRTAEGKVNMSTKLLDVQDLLSELDD